ncbi:type VI secretion system-associated protein TagF [Chitiniphilus purpureus]|uniref:Type VI secretion system-associated protein TagF n=1 Tax=Chitiniphilus purpureus TaxID=2981137 RepID=A0ABY6DJP5_9NEIS|nr:type VI secretion system-associated protein TagF [Chitiniphilus sp. CD1]UXY14570.1 type VI secretion system-associated protein TagF [Chitiniphilus sp. CD1]
MPISFVRTGDITAQYAVFGKLPRRADFVRINATHPVAQEFDHLLAKSLTWSQQQPEWQEARYLAAAASDFHFTSSDGRWAFFGVLQPSRDEAGRLYPLVAGAILPAAAVSSHLAELAIANELFFAGLRDQLAAAVDSSVEMLACRQFLDDQLTQSNRANADVELAGNVLERYFQQTPAARLQTELTALGLGGLDAHLLAFLFYGELLRRYVGSVPRQAILLPLLQQPGEDILGLATWLALHRAAAKGHARVPHCLTLQREGRRYLALAPECFPERFLGMLWGLAPEPTTVVNVVDDDAPWMHHQAYAEASYILGRQLADPALNLQSLRQILEKLTSSIA